MVKKSKINLSPLKVLYIPSWFPDKKNPKHGIYFKEQAEMLSGYCEVSILNIVRVPIKRFFIYLRNIFYFNNLFSTNNIFNFLYFDYSISNIDHRVKLFEKAVVKSFNEYKKECGLPDIIHAQVTYPAGFAAYTISKLYKIPYIVTEHSSNFDNYYKLFNKYYPLILKNAVYYGAVSNYVRNKVTRYRKQCDIIPNFIDQKKFSGKIKHNKNFNLINISDIEKLKGIDILLQSIKILTEKYKIKNVFLNILGGGEQLEEYKKYSEDLKISDYVNFTGLIEYSKIKEHLLESKILIIASRVETFGIVAIEAMACGLPVVATDCGGPKDFIKKFNGVLVKKEDPESLAFGIKTVIEKYTNYKSEKIKTFFKKNYTDGAVCTKIVKIYKKVLKIKK